MKPIFFLFALVFLFLSACETGPANLRLGEVRLKKFRSCDDLASALTIERSESFTYEEDTVGVFSDPAPEDTAAGDDGSGGETNNQVAGVDELDRAKASDDYLYRLVNSSIIVLRRFPVSEAGIIQKVDLERNGSEGGLFVHDDRVIAILSNWESVSIQYFRKGSDGTLTKENERTVDGHLSGARMIEDRIHLVVNKYLPARYVQRGEEAPSLGRIEESLPASSVGTTSQRLSECTDIYYEPAALSKRIPSYLGDSLHYYDFEINNLTCVFSLDISDQKKKPSGECVAGNRGSTIYSSIDNLFIASGGWRTDTPIHQFTLASDGEPTRYVGSALVKGQVGFANSWGGALDSFAMDEHDGHFRVATTIHNYTNDPGIGFKSNTINALWVFELVRGDPELVGDIQDLAAGERIYTVRFMGDRGFIVTFKKVDPLFAIDLSNPKRPEVKGELKISGFSSYLHPIEDGYLLAIGKEADPAEYSDDFEWYQGIQLSIFDVRDLREPKLVHKTVLGGRGTDSEALHDHKAFRFIADKNLVLFPISLYSESSGGNTFGEWLYSGFHLYHASVSSGFSEAGVSEFPNSNSYSRYSAKGRSFYRDGVVSMLGGGELVLRSSDNPHSDLRRVSAE